MGRASFLSSAIPMAGPEREVVGEKLTVDGAEVALVGVTAGNPHCVIPVERATASDARRLGPLIETHPVFPHRTNVQWLEILDRANIRIEIWERGAGYTLASGSSSSAAAAVAHKLELVDPVVTVHMPGGAIAIEIGQAYTIRMTGSVKRVADGELHPEIFEARVAADGGPA